MQNEISQIKSKSNKVTDDTFKDWIASEDNKTNKNYILLGIIIFLQQIYISNLQSKLDDLTLPVGGKEYQNMSYLQYLNPTNFSSRSQNKLYMQVYLFSIFSFYLVYYISHHILEKIVKLSLYVELSSFEKANYLSRITAQLHAVISSVMSYYNCYYLCQGESNIFDDDQCLF